MKTILPDKPALFDDFKRRRTRGQRVRALHRRAVRLVGIAAAARQRVRHRRARG